MGQYDGYDAFSGYKPPPPTNAQPAWPQWGSPATAPVLQSQQPPSIVQQYVQQYAKPAQSTMPDYSSMKSYGAPMSAQAGAAKMAAPATAAPGSTPPASAPKNTDLGGTENPYAGVNTAIGFGQVVGNLALSGYAAWMAGKQFDLQQANLNQNYTNQAKSYNAAMEDRIRGRYSPEYLERHPEVKQRIEDRRVSETSETSRVTR